MILNALLLALRAVRRNVMRSALTTLGIVIGVAAVIVMVSLGNATTIMVTDGIASLGNNLLTILPGQQTGPGGAASSASPFKVADAELIGRTVPAITTVAPASSMSMNVVLGNRNRSTMVTGATNAYFEASDWSLREGAWFSDADLRSGRAVCIVGETVRRELLGGAQSPLGLRVRLRAVSCEVIGLLAAKGENTFGQDRDDVVVMPLRAFQRRIAGNDDVAQIQVAVGPTSSTLRAQQEIERLLRERRRLAPGDDNDFMVMDPQDIANTLSGTIRLLTLLLAAVAGISLLVGGIGIMNIMIVSVTERTREIGLRMAIGALEREVLLQFLVEATVLSAFGGVVGVLLALATSAGVAAAFGLPFVVDWSMMVLAFVFSAGVGIVFGFVPAQRAARLNPIDALRHE
jgi:putative ABC transport system permease protein